MCTVFHRWYGLFSSEMGRDFGSEGGEQVLIMKSKSKVYSISPDRDNFSNIFCKMSCFL